MKPVTKNAREILKSYVAKLGVGDAIKLTSNVLMAVHIERIAPTRISIASYGEQNGDAMRDPDIVVLETPTGDYVPFAYRNDYLGMNREYVEFAHGDTPVRWNRKAQHDLAGFTSTWLNDIARDYTLCVPEKIAS